MKAAKAKDRTREEDPYSALLAAKFDSFPGDLTKLTAEFDRLKDLYSAKFPLIKRTLRLDDKLWRFFVLLHKQNQLLKEELQRLKATVAQHQQEKFEGSLAATVQEFASRSPTERAMWARKAEELRAEYRKKKAEQKGSLARKILATNKASGCAPTNVSAIDWTQRHTIDEFLSAIGTHRSIHKKKIVGYLKEIAAPKTRLRPGRNQPEYYDFETNLAVLRKWITDWIPSEREKAAYLLGVVTQLVVHSAPYSDEVRKVRHVVVDLWRQFGPACDGVSALTFSEMIESEDGWHAWVSAVRAHMQHTGLPG